jgi:trimeric autotransporter adhesin
MNYSVSRFLVTAGCVLLFLDSARAQPSLTPDGRFWRPDGPVHALLVHEDAIYLGGNFSYVGPANGGANGVDAVEGTPRPGFPTVDGAVYAVLPDGRGGWFIGGDFERVGDLPRANLARIQADLSVDPQWAPQAKNTVHALAHGAGRVYAGGAFTQLNGQSRSRMGALDAHTGSLLEFNPAPNSTVLTIVPRGDLLYVGGSFTRVGGQARNRLASVTAVAGQATNWDPNANNTVEALFVSENTLYV